MTVEYSGRAISDLAKAAADSRDRFGEHVAVGLEARIRAVVARIEFSPESGSAVPERPGVRVTPLIEYPYRLFYRILEGGGIRVLHIRHTSRRPGLPR